MVAIGLKEEAREWEAGLATGHEGRGWTGRERPDVKGPEGCLSMESGDRLLCLFTHWLVPSSQLCFFYNNFLLSGLSVMLESGCGQREIAFTCCASRARQLGASLATLPLTPLIWSAGPVCSPCQIYLRPLTHLKHEKINHNSQPFPATTPSLSISQTSTWNESWAQPCHSPPTATSFCSVLPPIPLSIWPHSPMNEGPNQ